MLPFPPVLADPAEVIVFWREAGPSQWFCRDDAFDSIFRARFSGLHEAAARGELDPWAESPEGALALLILLDQFPRNAFRGTPRMYATDAKARQIAKVAADAAFDLQFEPDLRQFFYLPLMHSEHLPDLDRCVQLARNLGDESLRWAVHHRGIIERFGRFPHRNDVLGRTSTPEEQDFLNEGGFGG